MAKSDKPAVPAPDAPSETPVAPAQPTFTITSADGVAQELMQRLPDLAAAEGSLRLVAALFASYVKNPLGAVTVKDATDELEVLYNTDVAGVRDALAEITKVDTAIAVALANEFRTRTGRALNTKTLNITGAVQSEQEEQQGLDRLARELLAKVQAVVNRLGIDDRYALAHADKKKVRRGSILVNLVNEAAGKLPGAQTEPDQKEAAPDWLTEPILDAKGNPDYGRMVKFIDHVIAIMDRYTDRPNMRQIVVDYLGNAKIDANQIEETLEAASAMAHKQLEQSSTILALVGRDQQMYADRIDGLSDLRHMYGAVAQFFFPA